MSGPRCGTSVIQYLIKTGNHPFILSPSRMTRLNRSGRGEELLYVPHQTDIKKQQVTNLALMSATQSLISSSFVLMVTANTGPSLPSEVS